MCKNDLELKELNTVSGGSKYTVDETVFGVQDYIGVCKTARSHNLGNGTELDNAQTLDWLWKKYVSYGLEDRLDQWGYGDIVEKYYFESPLFN